MPGATAEEGPIPTPACTLHPTLHGVGYSAPELFTPTRATFTLAPGLRPRHTCLHVCSLGPEGCALLLPVLANPVSRFMSVSRPAGGLSTAAQAAGSLLFGRTRHEAFWCWPSRGQLAQVRETGTLARGCRLELRGILLRRLSVGGLTMSVPHFLFVCLDFQRTAGQELVRNLSRKRQPSAWLPELKMSLVAVCSLSCLAGPGAPLQQDLSPGLAAGVRVSRTVCRCAVPPLRRTPEPPSSLSYLPSVRSGSACLVPWGPAGTDPKAFVAADLRVGSVTSVPEVATLLPIA
ncbi:uncharacterized protein LOC132538580 [Erinaceus europaeus]|uniref:Uncharacterized protein LOC132538580 n=1 Tax=Erinaceus europaeus TaxID=9365 RepID=A0ABM3XDY4_ERIEU|nr:uncharacterized protein LOC132538580 [Erinaceus europaeus]